jgi:endoglucanase
MPVGRSGWPRWSSVASPAMASAPRPLARPQQLATAALVLLVLGVVAVLVDGSRGDPTVERTTADERTLTVSERFLDDYVDPDGRVVRHDEGGTTVSEAQAYGLLVAAAIDDRERFDTILAWTDANLVRDDGLMAWHWDEGEVDEAVATDADIDAVHALLVAAERFDEPDHLERAREIATAIDRELVAEVADGPVLLPGEWADGPPFRWNPRYVSPLTFDLLDDHLPDTGRWEQLRDASYQQVERSLSGDADLPPDWAQVEADGSVEQDPHEDPAFGFDAARVPIRMGVDCDERGRALAARSHPFLSSQDPVLAGYDLDGSPEVDFRHPLMVVAAAGAAHAAGDGDAVTGLLDEAEAIDRREPTYYGAAWVALGRLLLTTDLLHGC